MACQYQQTVLIGNGLPVPTASSYRKCPASTNRQFLLEMACQYKREQSNRCWHHDCCMKRMEGESAERYIKCVCLNSVTLTSFVCHRSRHILCNNPYNIKGTNADTAQVPYWKNKLLLLLPPIIIIIIIIIIIMQPSSFLFPRLYYTTSTLLGLLGSNFILFARICLSQR
jgi:hypothetical protein